MTAQPRSDSTDSAATADLVVAVEALEPALDGAAALTDECLVRLDDGLVFRARDPADVAMAELRLSQAAFERLAIADERFGVDLHRLRNVVSMADGGGPVGVSLTDRDRLRVTIGPVEYTLAPIDARAVRGVEWIDDDGTAARVVLSAGDLQRAIGTAGLVSDHATFRVEPDGDALAVTANGDTDDVRVAFPTADLDAFDPGAVETIYSIEYLSAIVGAIPADAPVTIEFVDAADRTGRPLVFRYPFADGDGSAQWALAPRIQR